MTMGSIMSVRALNIHFGSRSVIQNLDFNVDAGDNLAIIGPNGAGKTVLLKALLGLFPYEGEIRWSPDARLGYVPQKVAADRQMPIRVHDLLAGKAHVLKLHARSIEAVAATVDLTPEVLSASIGTISGGQFQKALIAFALLGEPNVLLFDEPTASLDELAEERFYDVAERLQREQHLTVLLVSRDLSIVYRAANKVLCLSKDMVCFGLPREVLTPAALERWDHGSALSLARFVVIHTVVPTNTGASPDESGLFLVIVHSLDVKTAATSSFAISSKNDDFDSAPT